MKIALTVKNTSRTFKPTTNDVILYDGEMWYVTTKNDVLKEANETLQKCKEELAKIEEFKKEVASQLLEMSELLKQLYSK